MQYLRLLLFPFSLLYGLIILLRNKAYDLGIFKSKAYEIPVICIGNLTVGGAGKSPMAEYIIRLLKDKKRVAVLSRGYGRKTRGFRLVEKSDSPAEAGDEPLQFRQKFDDITVAVSEKRVIGIDALQNNHDVVILDDAFQHRAVKAGLNILLFDYTRLHEFFLVFPAGNFRDSFSSRARAQIIVITKTPLYLDEKERTRILKRIKPLKGQEVFFSYLDYGNLKPIFNSSDLRETSLASLESETIVFLITGIANPAPLSQKLKGLYNTVKHYDYPDHHPFTKKNITKLVSDFKADKEHRKIIITTEKDAQRLRVPELEELLRGLPVYYLPVTARIHEPDAERFQNLIEEYVS